MAQQHSDLPAERPRLCQAQGCEVDVNPYGRYCRKRRLCPGHLKASSLCRKKYGDEKWRFCQQCGKLELLHNFDGLKRSCRIQLARRRAANTTRGSGERRRSSAIEAEKTSSDENGSDRLSSDGDQRSAAAAAAAVSAPEDIQTDPTYAPAAAAAPNAMAAVGGGSGYGALQQGLRSGGVGLPAFADLAGYMQYGLDTVLTQEGQQLLQQQGMFDLQQQQPSHQPPAASLQLRAPAAAAAAAAGCGGGPAGVKATAEGPSSGNELLLQLLREQHQQFREWQQQQQQQQQTRTVGRPGEPPEHADVYSQELDPTSSPAMAASGDSSLRSLLAQQQPQQQQFVARSWLHSAYPQCLMSQQQWLTDSHSLSAAATKSTNSGSLQQTGSGPADTGFMGPTPPAAGAGAAAGAAAAAAAGALLGASNILNQGQYMVVSSVDGQQTTSLPLLQHATGCGGGLCMAPQQQHQQLVLLDPFLDPSSNQPSRAGRGTFSTNIDYKDLEGMLLAAAASTSAGAPPAAPAAAAVAAATAGAAQVTPAELRSLSAADTESVLMSPMLNERWQQRSLRAMDSAPARLTLPGENAAATAGTIASCEEVMCSGLLDLADDSRGMLDQYQATPQGRSAAAAAAVHALGGPMGMSVTDAHSGMHTGAAGAGAGVAMATGQRRNGSWQHQPGGALSGGAQGVGRVLQFGQQQLQRRGTPGAPAGQVAADLMMQQLQQSQHHLAAELQALMDSTR